MGLVLLVLLTPLNQKLSSVVDTAKPALAADTAVPRLNGDIENAESDKLESQ
jgi:hypothetical protein